MTAKNRAPRNRTLVLSASDEAGLAAKPLHLAGPVACAEIENRTIHQDLFLALPWLPTAFVDLLFLDPPYNLRKRFQHVQFEPRSTMAYAAWIESWFVPLLRVLRPSASVYFCGDW